MEELDRDCQLNMPAISLHKDWDLIDEAKKLLQNYGYSQQEAEDDGLSTIWFEKSFPTSEPSVFVFREDPEYKSPKRTTGWKEYLVFQQSFKNPARIKVEIPEIGVQRDQLAGVSLVAKPTVMEDETQFSVKLRIKKLAVGIAKDHFLSGGCHLGFYPYRVGIRIKPELTGHELDVIPILESSSGAETARVETRTTTGTIGVDIGCSLGRLKAERGRSRAVERPAENLEKVKLLPICDIEDANAAVFEWSILRRNDFSEYHTQKPHSNGVKEPPFGPVGAPDLAVLTPFPHICWEFPSWVKDKELKFCISLDVHLHLIWSSSRVFFASSASKKAILKYNSIWTLRSK